MTLDDLSGTRGPADLADGTGEEARPLVNGRGGVRPPSDRSGPRHAEAYASSGTFKTRVGGAPPVAGRRRGQQGPRQSWALRSRIGLALGACRDAMASAWENRDDRVLRDNAVNDFLDGLQHLWNDREAREPQFGRVVNLLHLLLAGVQPEELSEGQISTLGRVVRTTLASPLMTDSDVRDVGRMLAEGGFDVSRIFD